MEKDSISIITSCYRCISYLENFLKLVTEQSLFSNIELILVHNSPLAEEIEVIQRYEKQYHSRLVHLIVDPVEPLAASWNRGWRAARGEFIAIWNVDDIRTDDSLERQVDTLNRYPKASMTYGDFIEVKSYGAKMGVWNCTPEFSTKAFSKMILSGGAFMLFRKSSCNSVGPFDEQFKCSVDYEYTVRLVLNGQTFIRTDGLIGYFTNEHRGLSTQKGDMLRQTEDTVIQQRYGIFDKIKREFLLPAQSYRVYHVLSGEQWTSVSRYIQNYSTFLQQRQYLWAIGLVKNAIRRFLIFLKIWDTLVIAKMRLQGKIRPSQ